MANVESKCGLVQKPLDWFKLPEQVRTTVNEARDRELGDSMDGISIKSLTDEDEALINWGTDGGSDQRTEG